MDKQDVKEICSAVMLSEELAVLGGLAVMGEMMEAVVSSELCSELCGAEERCISEGKAVLRPDEVKAEFSREELLCGAGHRKGDFVVVPRVIE